MPKYRFGKHPAKVDVRTFCFKNYPTLVIAALTPAYNVLATGVDRRRNTTDPARLLPIDDSDCLPDCSIAASVHAESAYHRPFSEQDIVAKQYMVKLLVARLNRLFDLNPQQADF